MYHFKHFQLSAGYCVILTSSPGFVLPGFCSAGLASTIAVSRSEKPFPSSIFFHSSRTGLWANQLSAAPRTQQPLETQRTPRCSEQQWKALRSHTHTDTHTHTHTLSMRPNGPLPLKQEFWMSLRSDWIQWDPLWVCILGYEIQVKGFSIVSTFVKRHLIAPLAFVTGEEISFFLVCLNWEEEPHFHRRLEQEVNR